MREEVESGTRKLAPQVVSFVKQGSNQDPDVTFDKSSIADDGTVTMSRN